MKKILFNTNLFILLLAPVFILAVVGIFYRTMNLQLPNVETEIVGLFNKRTIFQVLCEVVKDQVW
jgi:hypothetical protein